MRLVDRKHVGKGAVRRDPPGQTGIQQQRLGGQVRAGNSVFYLDSGVKSEIQSSLGGGGWVKSGVGVLEPASIERLLEPEVGR